jgi:hypothetical protein
MTDANKPEEGNSKNTSKMPLILGILSCLIGSAGGYFAARSGLILPLESAVADIGPKHELEDLADVTDQVALIPKLSIQHPHDLTTPVGIDIRV